MCGKITKIIINQALNGAELPKFTGKMVLKTKNIPQNWQDSLL
jgi:hypothetical protein